jgi:hypothetical protein
MGKLEYVELDETVAFLSEDRRLKDNQFQNEEETTVFKIINVRMLNIRVTVTITMFVEIIQVEVVHQESSM